jgi:hypothetical protein
MTAIGQRRSELVQVGGGSTDIWMKDAGNDQNSQVLPFGLVIGL